MEMNKDNSMWLPFGPLRKSEVKMVHNYCVSKSVNVTNRFKVRNKLFSESNGLSDLQDAITFLGFTLSTYKNTTEPLQLLLSTCLSFRLLHLLDDLDMLSASQAGSLPP